MVDKRSKGRRCDTPPPSLVKTLHSRLALLPPPPSSLGMGDETLRFELCAGSRKITLPKLHHLWNLWAAVQPKATAAHKHITGIFSDFSFGAAHTMYFADRQLIYYTWQKCQAVLAARHITSEQSQRDWRVMSNRTRPADPSCNMDSHLAEASQQHKQAEDEILKESPGSAAIMWNKYMVASVT